MSQKTLDLPDRAWGWVSVQRPSATLVRLRTGELVHAVKLPGLPFGTPVTVEIFDRSDDALVGRVLHAASPRRPSPDTPIAFLDESNIAAFGEPADPVDWRFGSVKVYATALVLERIGFSPELCADPLANARAYVKHKPSARAVSAAKWRWHRRIFDFGEEQQNADVGLLEAATLNPSAIIVSNDKFREHILRARFPWLNTLEGQSRIHRVEVHADRVEIPSLGISELIPTPLFT